MKLNVWLRDETCICSDNYSLTFHGLVLDKNMDRFFSEKSALRCKRHDKTNTRWIPFSEIVEITEVSDD